jgi:hypothetical protein
LALLACVMAKQSWLSFTLLAASAVGQTIYPPDYTAVPEGPLNSPNLPLALGTSRVLCLYEAWQLGVIPGQAITQLGFRQDGATAAMDPGRQLQLEVRMGYTNNSVTTAVANFDANYASAPAIVFGPATFALPNLRDAGAPLPGGQFFVPLTTPFVYAPAAGQNLLIEFRVFGTSGGGSSFQYRLDRADSYSTVSYGPAGCPHSAGGTPSLTAQPTRPGQNYTCAMSSGPANSVGVLALDLGHPLTAPYALGPVFPGIAPACQGQLQPGALALLNAASSGSGSANWSFPIPNDNAFAKYTISSQALFLDFFAPGGMVVSRGAEVLTGLRPRCTVISAAGVPTVVLSGAISQFYCPVTFFVHA